MPAAFVAHLAASLAKKPRFHDWPLARIIPDREAFFAFLQERLAAIPGPDDGRRRRARGSATGRARGPDPGARPHGLR